MLRVSLPKTPSYFRIIDYAMIPLMYFLGGFKSDAVQETHPWHSFRGFNIDEVDRTLAIENTGTESTSFKQHFLFLFHAPIFGGWKQYVTFAPEVPVASFNIGWIVYDTHTKKLLDRGINTLPVTNGMIRVLSGPPNFTGYFFAVDANGEQIKLKEVGRGTLGDKQFPGIRLF
jgi:hypothetical protein